MPEDLIVQQCSPTLAGLKTGNLFSCPFRTEAELRADIADLNRRLAPKGVRVCILRVQKRALLYFYRPSSLRRDFGTAEVAALLKEYGYAADDAEACIRQLRARIAGASGFPHEIGLFLGYPAEDVRGFIENRSDGCKCVGTWKVYGDEAAARKRFALYEKCTRIYQARYSEGKSIERLTVPSGS